MQGLMRSLYWLRLLVSRSIAEFADDNCTQMAAAISYYVLFSLFPLLIFLVGIAGVLLRDTELQEQLVEVVLEYIPFSEDEGRNEVRQVIRSAAGVGSGALGILGLIGMGWSGSNMFAIIRRSLNSAFDLSARRPFVRQKLVDLGLMLSLGPFFLCSIIATALLRSVQSISEDAVGARLPVDYAWAAASISLPVLLSFVAFLMLYRIAPATHLRLRDVWPGAIVAAVLFEGAKVGFSIYLENLANYSLVFGSLGAVVAFLFWVYLSANILLLGAEVASEYPRVMRGEYDTEGPAPPRPPLKTVLWRRFRSLFLEEDSGQS
ncbi:MAG: YihY family inner membrane protein [Dehalococcoidia bacterium]|nr:YihY family inner membrane protein [Dehalococcoidia bacterium]